MLLAWAGWKWLFLWECCFSKPFEKAGTAVTLKDGDIAVATQRFAIEMKIFNLSAPSFRISLR